MVNGLKEFVYENDERVLDYYVKVFLQMCPNIKKINIVNGWIMFDTIHPILVDSLKKLEVINKIEISEKIDTFAEMELFVAKYGKSLKVVRFYFKYMSSDDLHKCLTLISRFESLEGLELEINYSHEEPIDECLKLLANKCTKLREFYLRIINSSVISDNIFFTLSEFRSLERLVFNSKYMTHFNGSVECLKHMTRIKHLSITCEELSEDFFANIQTFLPNIRNLDIYTRIGFHDNSIKPFVESLQTMKYIEKVVINGQTFIYCKNR